MMNDKYFKELFRKNPREAVELYYQENINKINKKNYLELSIYKSISAGDSDSFVKDCIFESFFENKDNISQNVRSMIDEKVKKLIGYMYEQTDQEIPFPSYVAYYKFISTFTYEKMMKYEDDAFTFEEEKIEGQDGRIYYTLTSLYDDYREKLSQGDISAELYSFIVDKMEEIDRIVKEYGYERATEMLVALQLYLDIGTDFISVLPLYLSGELTLTEELGLDYEKGLDQGKGLIR